MNKKTLIALASIGLLLSGIPAFAASTSTPTAHSTLNVACIQSAVDTREDALESAFTAFTTAENTALAARKTALHDAWGTTDATARRTARNKAWSDFRVANRKAFETLRNGRKTAWSTFTTASKACGTGVIESAGQEGAGSLGI